MFLVANQNPGMTLLFSEAGLTGLLVASSLIFPRLGSHFFGIIEKHASTLAHYKKASILLSGFIFLFLRLMLLPVCPIPFPCTGDDFSVLLSADTFLHGRLSNPTPAMWPHFESLHINLLPTYTSMYFPGMGIMCALGSILFGHPWYGILATATIMCMAVCWMLQGWLPPSWALLGSFLFILRLALFSYWTNSYTGGATLTVTAGALILGALPRFFKKANLYHGLAFGFGFALLIITRPFEGMLLGLPVGILAMYNYIKKRDNSVSSLYLKCMAITMAFIIAAITFLGYYDYKAYGNPLILPYTAARNMYAIAPYYIWQPMRAVPFFRHLEMKNFYCNEETLHLQRMRSLSGFIPETARKFYYIVGFYMFFALLPSLFMLKRALCDRRIRIIVYCLPFWIAGYAIGLFLLPHYTAPFAAVVYLLLMQMLRHLYCWKDRGNPAGKAMVRYIVTLCILLAGIRTLSEPLHLNPPEWPAGSWLLWWSGPGVYGSDRANVEKTLEAIPGKHLLIVRYSNEHEPMAEWVYNSADIDHQKIVWAKEVDNTSNTSLLHYYSDRTVWLLEPDLDPKRLIPYQEAH